MSSEEVMCLGLTKVTCSAGIVNLLAILSSWLSGIVINNLMGNVIPLSKRFNSPVELAESHYNLCHSSQAPP